MCFSLMAVNQEIHNLPRRYRLCDTLTPVLHIHKLCSAAKTLPVELTLLQGVLTNKEV